MAQPIITLDTKVPDSVESNELTGGRRSSQEGKGRPDLVSPLSEHRLALVMERGAKIYGDRNWERGLSMSRYMAATLRHLRQYREGDRSEDHLAQAYWNIHCLLHTEECISRGLLPEALNDIPSYLPKASE